MKRILVVVFMAVSIQLALGAEVPGVIERPGADDGPTRVSIGIWMVDITSIDSAQQNFTADIAIVSSGDQAVRQALLRSAPRYLFDLNGRLGAEIEALPGYEGIGW